MMIDGKNWWREGNDNEMVYNGASELEWKNDFRTTKQTL